jgi:two-component system heavy metal sensor histidine kinase CusS
VKGLPRSIGLRLTLALSAIALAVFAATGVLLHHALADELVRMSHAELGGKIDVVKQFVREARTQDGLRALREHLDYVLVEHPDMQVWLEAADGSVLYGGTLPQTVAHLDHHGHLVVERQDGVRMEAMEERLLPSPLLPVARILVGFDMREREWLLGRYRNALVAVCAIGVLLSAALAAAAILQTLRPMKRLSAQAAAITPRSLTSRLSDDVDKELGGLVAAFNGVLERLEGAYRQMEAFNADAAHELRTPLATLISGNQVILAQSRTIDELRDTLTSNLEDLERLKALVNDMLFLARADRGEMAASVEPVDLGAETDKTIEYLDAFVEEAGLTVQRRGDAVAMCNPALVRRALSNLLTNATKHTDRGGHITVDIARTPNGARLSVSNPGTPIAPGVAQRMFDRFYRADPARRQSSDSHGLGLAIVQAIARMHGGGTFVEPGAQGNVVGFDLSLGPPPGNVAADTAAKARAPERPGLHGAQ